MKLGFEIEAFCTDQVGNPILVPDKLPMDECGWLVEVRSQPDENVTRAIYLLKAESEIVQKQADKANVKLEFVPLMEIPRDLKVKAARRSGKGQISYQNVYGFETHRNSSKLATASLHVSFTNEKSYTHQKRWIVNGGSELRDDVFKYQGFVDHAKFIVGLDRAFKTEISKAKRNPGFYEVKPDGRIEYRSLPNDIDLDKLASVLKELLR